MARGRPDWSDFFTVRRGYGPAVREETDFNIAIGATVTLNEIVGKGVIYFGHLWLDGAISHRTDYLHGWVDGGSVIDVDWDDLIGHGHQLTHMGLFNLVKFDDTNFAYIATMKEDTSFNSSFRVDYENKTAEEIYVRLVLVYGLG